MRNVFILGDSISIQYGPHLERLLAGRIGYARKDGAEQALANLDIPAGANGGDSRRCLTYLRARCAEPAFRPDLLLLNCGLHDIKRAVSSQELQIPLDEYRRNLTAIATLLSERGTPLGWVRTTPVDDALHNSRSKEFHRHAADQAAFNAAADAVMSVAGARSIDLEACTLACGGAEVFCDHVHFAPTVRQNQASFIAGHLLAWLT